MAGVVCAFLIAASLNNRVAYADSIPGGNVSDPVVRAVDIAKPAVVRIITLAKGHLAVQFSPTNTVTFPEGNAKNYEPQLSGTGTFITANGDILTADHVVNPPDDVLQQEAAPDIAKYINNHPGTGISQSTPDQVYTALRTKQLKSVATYEQKISEVFLSTDYTGPLSASDLGNVPDTIHATVDQIKKESSFNQRDVAIVHAPFKDMPSVQLGNSSSVQQQDQLTIIGFPGNADVSNKPTDLLTSSVNKITVSSIKSTDTGAPLIQVGGNVEHGDSGGPALDNKGTVVGIVSFGIADNGSPGGTSFLQASSSAQEMVQSLNLDTTPGPFQKAWNDAFTTYASNTPGHWRKAQQQFEQLATSYPLFKAVTPYLNYAKEQARTEAVPTQPNNAGNNSSPLPANSTALALTIGSVVLLVLLAGVLFATIVRTNKKKVAKQAPQSAIAAPLPPQAAAARPSGVNNHVAGGMTAFGAPPSNSQPGHQGPQQPLSPIPGQPAPTSTFTLRAWPCGHMNRPNARFCSICGEPAQASTFRRVEQ